METKIFQLNDINPAAEIIKAGGVVGVPTETVYGIGVDAMNSLAVQRLFAAKCRPIGKPISVLVSGMQMVDTLCVDIPPIAFELAEKFWPGPMTMVFRDGGKVAKEVLAGGTTLGVRCPDHPVTLDLIKAVGRPLATPSANLSGQPSPKNAGAVLDVFDGRINAIVDGGPCYVGVESTIIDFSEDTPIVLREGGLSIRTLQRAMPGIQLRVAQQCSLRQIKVFGITGGTGCGKTTALRVMEEMQVWVIDCDQVYHELLESGAELREALRNRFGGGVFREDGQLDRKALGNVVFSDSEALADLNSITHKYINEEVNQRIKQAMEDRCAAVAIDAIALIEGGLADRCDATIGIIAPTEIRIARIMDREKISKEYARLRVKAQQPDSFYRTYCDYILENSGENMEEFKIKVCELLKCILND